MEGRKEKMEDKRKGGKEEGREGALAFSGMLKAVKYMQRED